MSIELAISQKQIENRIFTIRGVQVMIDRDLAKMYQVEVKRLNEQVRRNIERFPEAFRFQLNEFEKNELVANCDRFETIKHSSNNPYAFTEQGVLFSYFQDIFIFHSNNVRLNLTIVIRNINEIMHHLLCFLLEVSVIL